jgi:hypothetical protein
MKTRTIKIIKTLLLTSVALFIGLNGYFIGTSMKNLMRDNGTSLVDTRNIEFKLEIQSAFLPSFSLNLTQYLFGGSQSDNSSASFFNLNATMFSFNETSVIINGSFTIDSLITGINLTIKVPMIINNSGYYDIDEIRVKLTFSNETSAYTIGPIITPKIKRNTIQKFDLTFGLNFSSLAAMREFSNIIKSPKFMDFNLETTVFFFFPIRLTVFGNLTEIGGQSP